MVEVSSLPLSFSLFLSVSLSFFDYLPTYLLIYLSTYLSVCLSIYLPIYLSIYLFIQLSLSICLSVSLSIYLSIFLFSCLSIYLSVSLSICLSIYLSIFLFSCLYLFVCLSIYLSVYLSIYLPISLSIYLSFYLSIYLPISLSIFLSTYLSIYPSIYLSINLSFYSAVSLSICLSLYLFVCLSIYLCTFSTSEPPKVVRTPSAFNILTSKCASRHNGVHFFNISTAKSGPELVCFVHFDRNVLRATTACTFSTSQLPKAVRTWCVLYILTWKCASRHNGVQFFISHLASWLRTRRFSEPTFRPSGAPNHWKNTVFHDFPTFSRICIFFLLTLSLLLFFLLNFSSVHVVGSLTSKLPSINDDDDDGN